MRISGQWGVGKTFAWNQYLKDAKAKNKIALKRYSYVSLFGINSLDELKYSIFENSVKSSEIGVEPSIETLRSNTSAAAERLGRKSLRFIQQIRFVKSFAGDLPSVWYLSVKETIVCMDDIERRGKNLDIRDVLGLISSLKEQKKCKVVLILNDEAMQEEKEFTTYLEKVVDTSLTFAPTPQESVRIALTPDSQIDIFIAENCVALGISNIRLVKRIQRSVSKIEPMLRKFDEGVLRQAVHSLVLLVWSVYEPARAPSLDYLRRRGASVFGDKEEAVSVNEGAWNALLDVYRFSVMDEFDLALLDGVQKGFFNPFLVDKHASDLDAQIKTGKLNSSFIEAWKLYHDSFESNQDHVLDAIYQSFLKDVQNISPLSLASTVALFKSLGRAQQATEIIQFYVQNRGAERRLFDLAGDPFGGEITDPDVIKVFKDKNAEFRDERSVGVILLDMATKNGWNDEDIASLSSADVSQYYEAFKEKKGQELHSILNSALQFDRLGNIHAAWKEISKRAKEALRRIGKESTINARQVKKYGVEVD